MGAWDLSPATEYHEERTQIRTIGKWYSVSDHIASDDADDRTLDEEWVFAKVPDGEEDPDYDTPHEVVLIPNVSTGICDYEVMAHGVLDALRPEVVVGAAAVSKVTEGEIVVYDHSDPLNPVVAKRPDGTLAEWDLE